MTRVFNTDSPDFHSIDAYIKEVMPLFCFHVMNLIFFTLFLFLTKYMPLYNGYISKNGRRRYLETLALY